ncbi:MAG: hypothetical protein Q7T34_01055 [Candidatus Parcubacteria bacterium]|nr:hypothetical protein [Candidatus Parcubacteria bacterium]
MSIQDLISIIMSPGSQENAANFAINYVKSQEVQNILLPVRIIFIGTGVFFFGFIIFALLNTKWLRQKFLESAVEFFTFKPYGLKRMTNVWNKVIKRLENPSEAEYKLAIIEADSLLNDLLKGMSFAGKTLEDKLKNLTEATLPSVNKVLEAHQVRNNIVHDPDYRLTLDKTKEVIGIYEQALIEMEAI